jgi:hypothetical protein
MALPAHLLAQKLHQILLLGLNRMEIDYSTRSALEAIGTDPDLSTEEQLLTGIAIIHQWEKTGQPFLQANDVQISPLPDEILPTAPPQIELLFMATLSGIFRSILPELLFLLHKKNLLLPLHRIPVAMEKALADPALWRYLYPVMGKRGLWMTEQFAPWRLFFENNPLSEKMPKDPKTARYQILQALAGESGYVYPRNAEDIAAPPEKPWEENFALQVLEYIALRTIRFSPINDEGPATLLLICAQSCPPSLFYRFNSYLWPQEGYFWMQWQPLIKKFTAIVDFRKSMYDTLFSE